MLLDISLVLKWWWEQCERLYERQRSVLKTSHLLTLATFLQLWLSSQPPAAPSTSLLPGSHLACHSGTLLPSPFSCWKRASNPHQEEKVQRTTALRVLCEPPATLPLSLSNCFSSFPTFLPRMFICRFFCYTHLHTLASCIPTAKDWTGPPHGDTALECWLPFIHLPLWPTGCSELTTLQHLQHWWHNISWLCRHEELYIVCPWALYHHTWGDVSQYSI